MDTDDVSDIGRYAQLLEVQKTTLRAALAREGQVPTDRKPRSQLVTQHQLMEMQTMMARMQQQNEHQIHSSFLPPPYPPSTANLKDLTLIYIKDLRIGLHHRGSYLLVKSATGPIRMTALMAIVEDEKGDSVSIQIYQQPGEAVRPASSFIAKGDAFIVKEPYFKVMSDGGYGLRIDHVGDL